MVNQHFHLFPHCFQKASLSGSLKVRIVWKRGTGIHYSPLHYITLHYITLHCITLHCITLHYITLHCIALHYIALHYITLHYITLAAFKHRVCHNDDQT